MVECVSQKVNARHGLTSECEMSFSRRLTNNNNALRDVTRCNVVENYERFGAPRWGVSSKFHRNFRKFIPDSTASHPNDHVLKKRILCLCITLIFNIHFRCVVLTRDFMSMNCDVIGKWKETAV
jgi:hypothetical protein